jgi:hypothetical protein
LPRIGLYAWGGPGTIRLLKVKYHSPQIDERSFMSLYDAEFLQEAQQKIGVTDMWVTYSWGFSDSTEHVDRRFIVERLENFQRQGIATHAYIQGLNLVTEEFKTQDVFCRDSRGRLLPYSKGRSLTCPNNPAARDIITHRVEAACQEAFDGIFVDNILFGLPPFFFRSDYTSFWGCSCDCCQRQFRSDYGYTLPLSEKSGEQVIADYIDFRCRIVADLLHYLSGIARSAGKQFGINLYDPLWHVPELHFGYSLPSIKNSLDYFLIENHALEKQSGIDNTHLLPLISSTSKPVFVVSYRDGIGYDSAYRQTDLQAIWADAASLNYSPCLKATEFVTDNVWHALRIDSIDPLALTPDLQIRHNGHQPKQLRASSRAERYLVQRANRHYPGLTTLVLENRTLAYLVGRSRILVRLARSRRFYHLSRNNHKSLFEEES